MSSLFLSGVNVQRCLISLSLLFGLSLPLPAQSAMLADDIRNQYLPDEYQTILVGDEDMPVFSAEPTTALSRGVALIFTDAGYQGLTLKNALILAAELNQKGWHTRVVPPAIDSSPVPAAPANSTTANESEETIDQQQTENLLHPRAWALTTFADPVANQATMALLAGSLLRDVETLPGFRLLISQGMSAAQLVSLTASETIDLPDGLVVISPYWPQAGNNDAIASQLADTPFPVLDLQLPQRTQWTNNSSSERKQAATKALKLHYRSRQLSNSMMLSSAGDNGFSSNVGREIVGWTNFLGW